MFARVKKAVSSKSMLATRSGGMRFLSYSCAEEIRRLLGSFQIIDPELSIARITSWSTWVTSAVKSFGTNWKDRDMAVPLAGSNRRLPGLGMANGEVASVPSGIGIANWEPGTTASWVAKRSFSKESIAARDVVHSALYSWDGRAATSVIWRNRRMTRSVNIVATVEATPLESRRRGRVITGYGGRGDERIKAFPSENHSCFRA